MANTFEGSLLLSPSEAILDYLSPSRIIRQLINGSITDNYRYNHSGRLVDQELSRPWHYFANRSFNPYVAKLPDFSNISGGGVGWDQLDYISENTVERFYANEINTINLWYIQAQKAVEHFTKELYRTQNIESHFGITHTNIGLPIGWGDFIGSNQSVDIYQYLIDFYTDEVNRLYAIREELSARLTYYEINEEETTVPLTPAFEEYYSTLSYNKNQNPLSLTFPPTYPLSLRMSSNMPFRTITGYRRYHITYPHFANYIPFFAVDEEDERRIAEFEGMVLNLAFNLQHGAFDLASIETPYRYNYTNSVRDYGLAFRAISSDTQTQRFERWMRYKYLGDYPIIGYSESDSSLVQPYTDKPDTVGGNDIRPLLFGADPTKLKTMNKDMFFTNGYTNVLTTPNATIASFNPPFKLTSNNVHSDSPSPTTGSMYQTLLNAGTRNKTTSKIISYTDSNIQRIVNSPFDYRPWENARHAPIVAPSSVNRKQTTFVHEVPEDHHSTRWIDPNTDTVYYVRSIFHEVEEEYDETVIEITNHHYITYYRRWFVADLWSTTAYFEITNPITSDTIGAVYNDVDYWPPRWEIKDVFTLDETDKIETEIRYVYTVDVKLTIIEHDSYVHWFGGTSSSPPYTEVFLEGQAELTITGYDYLTSFGMLNPSITDITPSGINGFAQIVERSPNPDPTLISQSVQPFTKSEYLVDDFSPYTVNDLIREQSIGSSQTFSTNMVDMDDYVQLEVYVVAGSPPVGQFLIQDVSGEAFLPASPRNLQLVIGKILNHLTTPTNA